MSEASALMMHPPKRGERFRCEKCGMEIAITADCRCKDPEHIHFEWCNKEMIKV
jgi:hypothetical protein